MNLSDFDYELPPQFIAQHPVEPRDSSRLMVIDRKTGSIKHAHFPAVADYLRPGDTLVFNNSRVIPARLKGTISGTGKQAEVLLLKHLPDDTWEAMVRPGRKLLPGATVVLGGTQENNPATVEIIQKEENGLRVVKLSGQDIIEKIGEMPLPPYIKARLEDKERYQTVFSAIKGSAAAPTAGLHFTPELLAKIKDMGVNLAFVTLHIGLDTFQPVREEDPTHHVIHTEYGEIDQQTADIINRTHSEGGRVFAVGTTSVRLLEAAAGSGVVKPLSGPINLYILPGYEFKVVDHIITNFHLPKSTLLMMISAFAGREFILNCYEQAKAAGYRFYSFGDAMLIL